MLEIGIDILAFVVAIGVLVAVHEFGHFWVARRLGVKVLRFSIGFGRPLWIWRRGADQTEYAICAIPLGGYVKMLDEREGPVDESELHRAFNRKPLWVRCAVVVAGPAFNFLFAIVAYWAIFVAGTTQLKPIIGAVIPGSPAAQAGFQAGDEFLRVDGERARSWDDVLMDMLAASVAGGEKSVVVQGKSGREKTYTLNFDRIGALEERVDLLKTIGFRPWPQLDTKLASVVPGGPADKAGLEGGDVVDSVAGKPVHSWQDLVAAVGAHAGDKVDVTVRRGDQDRTFSVNLAPKGAQGGVIGVAHAPLDKSAFDGKTQTVRYGPLTALGHSVADTWRGSVLTLQVLGKMLIGQASLKNLSGPINIARYAGDTASLGIVPFLRFLAIVSLSLGVLNLLPVPVLDGGHLLYYVIEGAKGSPLSERSQLIGQQIGLALLLLLMTLAFYNDIARLFGE